MEELENNAKNEGNVSMYAQAKRDWLQFDVSMKHPGVFHFGIGGWILRRHRARSGCHGPFVQPLEPELDLDPLL